MEFFLKLFWDRWWLRGVAAALGLLLFIREFFGYTLFEQRAPFGEGQPKFGAFVRTLLGDEQPDRA